MKLLLTLALALFTFTISAQQKSITIPYDSWPGAETKGLIYLPYDYEKEPDRKYPILFSYHGVGEAGSDLNKLASAGLPGLLKNGMRLDNITNPADGKKYSFIVVSALHGIWSPNSAWLPYTMRWVCKNFRGDSTRVYTTGYSAGGQIALGTIFAPFERAKLVSASVPMSPAWHDTKDSVNIGLCGINTWFISGSNDGQYTNVAKFANEVCNRQFTGSSKITIFQGGHCCWNTFYNKEWRESGMSIYEWMLQFSKSGTLPVTYSLYQIFSRGNNVHFDWETTAESNCEGFEIEESDDGINFKKVGFVTSLAMEGNSSTILKYNFSI